MVLNSDYKNKVGKELTIQLAVSLRDGKISNAEMSEIAAFVLEKINNVNTTEELSAFLDELGKKWPLFENLTLMEKKGIMENEDQKKVEELSTLIKNNQLDKGEDINDKK